jgi:hypothetical protein
MLPHRVFQKIIGNMLATEFPGGNISVVMIVAVEQG